MEEIFELFKKACVLVFPSTHLGLITLGTDVNESSFGFPLEVSTYYTARTYAPIFVMSWVQFNASSPMVILNEINSSGWALGWLIANKEEVKKGLEKLIAIYENHE